MGPPGTADGWTWEPGPCSPSPALNSALQLGEPGGPVGPCLAVAPGGPRALRGQPRHLARRRALVRGARRLRSVLPRTSSLAQACLAT